jgi:hypothetical protein
MSQACPHPFPHPKPLICMRHVSGSLLRTEAQNQLPPPRRLDVHCTQAVPRCHMIFTMPAPGVRAPLLLMVMPSAALPWYMSPRWFPGERSWQRSRPRALGPPDTDSRGAILLPCVGLKLMHHGTAYAACCTETTAQIQVSADAKGCFDGR